MKIKSILSGIFSLALVVACSTPSDDLALVDGSGAIKTFSEDIPMDSTRVNLKPTAPLMVFFNNAYKMLYEENDAIGKRDSVSPDKYLVSLINSANKTIDAAYYDIDNEFVTSAFINAQKRGVKVRFVTDSDNMKDKMDPAKPRKQVVDMQAAGIPVREDKRSGIMHHKFVVADDKTVWMGSMNLTSTSMYQHNNNSVRIESPELAANYNAEFQRLFEKGMFGPNPHEIPNKEVKVGNSTMKLYFSPKGGTKAAVIDELSKAQKSIRFLTFSLTDVQTRDLILAKKAKGIRVDGVMDECMSRNKYSLYRPFRESSIYVLKDGNQALLHHKVMIIDDSTVITGSFNYSDSAENSNNESTLIVKSPEMARSYNQEYERLKYAALNHKNIPVYENPACGTKPKPVAPTLPATSSIPEVLPPVE